MGFFLCINSLCGDGDNLIGNFEFNLTELLSVPNFKKVEELLIFRLNVPKRKRMYSIL